MTEITATTEADTTNKLIPEGWRQKGGRVNLEIGPGDGFFQYHQTLTGNRDKLKNTALVLIDQRKQIKPNFRDALENSFGNISFVAGDAVDTLNKGVIPENSVDTIDVNNVFGDPNLPLDVDKFVEAISKVAAPGGTINIRETNTPNHFDPNTSEKLLKALTTTFGSADLITDRNHSLFEAFRETARPESYGIVVKVPK
jgi:hypothetical protein